MPTPLLVLVVMLCTIGSQIVLKSEFNALISILREQGVLAFLVAAAISPKVIAALAIQGCGYVVWLFVLTHSRLSVAFAISGSFFYLTIAAASWFFFSERLTVSQWGGPVLISAWVLLMPLGDGAQFA